MRLSGCLLISALAMSVAAADVPVDVRAPSGSQCLVDSVVVARSGAAEVKRPVADAQTVLSLDEDRTWRVSIDSKQCWSGVLEWTRGHDGPLALTVVPAGEVGGTLSSDARPPQSLSGTLFVPGETVTDCSLTFPKWRCRVPGGVPFDVRLELPGTAAVHFWGITVRPREMRELAPQRLIPGASISGWVHDPDGKPLANARVVLTPFESAAPDEPKPIALRRTAKTNHRGFFQLAGLPPEDYQLVSHVHGFSPAVVPLATVREGERLEWPRAIAHLPLASLDVTLQPPTDASGQPWIVELVEHTQLPAEAAKQPLKRAASPSGRWSATGLRADLYRVHVRNSSDSVLHRAWADLSAGGAVMLDVQVSRFVVEGQLTAGEEPLEAEIRFEGRAGKSIRVNTDKEGRFETAFPGSGAWEPTVFYRLDGVRSQVSAPAIHIPDGTDGPARVNIELPAGRIRGTVTMPDGTPVKAAVHVRSSEGALIAQQVTAESGKFNFIGLREAGYALDAEGAQGVTAKPLPVRAEDGTASELRVVIEPYRQFAAQILTPSGAVASGAVVDLSPDGGRSWTRQAVRSDGVFRYAVPAGVDVLQLIVLTHAYPSAFARIVMDHRRPEPIVIRLQRTGGLLHVKGRTAYVLRADAIAPFTAFYFPEPFGRFGGGIHLEPGPYTICPRPQRDGSCREVVITPHGETTVEFEHATKETEAP